MSIAGASPYPSVPSVERLFQLIRDGHRMERPQNCSIDVYMIMRECWNAEPKWRPQFTDLVEDLDRLLINAREGDYLDMGLLPPASTASMVSGSAQFLGGGGSGTFSMCTASDYNNSAAGSCNMPSLAGSSRYLLRCSL